MTREMTTRLCRAEQLPSFEGTVALVTGANSGLGLETTRALAAKGATVVMACRSPERAAAAERALRVEDPTAKLEPLPLDLTDLDSVDQAAEAIAERHGHLDLLINNAGVMATPLRRTAQGFELQLGTNHLGHFAFTLRLAPLLLAARAPRVVNVTSLWHRVGRLRVDDPNWARGYSPWPAYAQSKLANTLFTLGLTTRAPAHLTAVSAHPGYAHTALHEVGPRMSGTAWLGGVMNFSAGLFAQSAARGALPTLAACCEGGPPGALYGPNGVGQVWGCGALVSAGSRALDGEAAEALWEMSEELVGLRWSDVVSG